MTKLIKALCLCLSISAICQATDKDLELGPCPTPITPFKYLTQEPDMDNVFGGMPLDLRSILGVIHQPTDSSDIME